MQTAAAAQSLYDETEVILMWLSALCHMNHTLKKPKANELNCAP